MTRNFTQIMENMKGLIKNESWSASSGFLLAVSGGMDSMCMADLFLSAYGSEAFAIAHCNFHLRGEESDADENLVKTWSESNGIRFHHIDFDTEGFASSKGISIEMAARELRYTWFAGLCDEYGYKAVVVAHNANDNAETLMLNLLRGTGLKGLAGMSQISESTSLILRPLLGFTRKQIEGYVFANKVPYRDDSSNASSDYKRNRIRNEVFPIFEKVNPSFIRSINREMSYFSEASDIVEDWCRTQIPDLVNDAGQQDALRINLPALLSRKHWRYLLYYMLEPYGFNSQILASLENLLESDRTASGKRFESLSYDLFVERTELVVINKDENKVGALSRPAGEVCMPVRGAGIYNFNGLRWQVEVLDWREDMPLKQAAGTLIADADKLLFPFVCRRWSQGDWFIPLGMRGRKKVSDLFTDLKYGTFRKEMAVMMVDCRGDLAESQHIAGVLGVRLDDAYKVDKNTKSIIRITILNNTETL